MFPQLEGTRFACAGGLNIDQTPAFVPFTGRSSRARIHAGLGYGHGSQDVMGGKDPRIGRAGGLEDEWTTLAVNRPETMKATLSRPWAAVKIDR